MSPEFPTTYGDDPDEMGDVLPAIDFGPGRAAISIAAGFKHNCFVLDQLDIKCWGDALSNPGHPDGHGCFIKMEDLPELPVIEFDYGTFYRLIPLIF